MHFWKVIITVDDQRLLKSCSIREERIPCSYAFRPINWRRIYDEQYVHCSTSLLLDCSYIHAPFSIYMLVHMLKLMIDKTSNALLFISPSEYTQITLPETNSSHLKMDGWNTSFLLGWPIFRCENVSFREGTHTRPLNNPYLVSILRSQCSQVQRVVMNRSP